MAREAGVVVVGLFLAHAAAAQFIQQGSKLVGSGALGAMAEGKGFEPLTTCAVPVFKTGALGRSATPPRRRKDRVKPGRAQGDLRGPGAVGDWYTPPP